MVIARVWQTAMTTDRVETLFVHGEARLISMYYIVYRQPDLGRMPEKERLADLLPRPLCPIQKSLRGRRKSGIWRFPVLWIVGRPVWEVAARQVSGNVLCIGASTGTWR